MTANETDDALSDMTREPMHLRLLGVRLSILIRLIRESGLPIYDREVGYKEIHRQLIIMIGAFSGLTSHEIVALTGHEKAQVSRAVKPLEQDGLIGRERLRGKFTLLPAGEQLYARIMAVGRDRDAALTAGIAAAEVARFSAMTDALIINAAQLYAEERRLSAEAGVLLSCAGSPWPTGAGQKPLQPALAVLIIPKIFSLVTYLKRSAMLAYQRAYGLSNFQWQVLSLIGELKPMPLANLIQMMGRDKSQIGRTVAHLEQAGLVERSRPTRRRDILLAPTRHGEKMFQSMYDLAMRRDDSLWAGHTDEDRSFYATICDNLARNAQAMMETEKAREAN